jgi:purine-nucleoside phosphorylase
MDYNALISSIKRFGSTEQDICMYGLSTAPGHIKENVIIAPWWEPDSLPGLGKAELLSSSSHAISVWNITGENHEMTYIKTGIGAPMLLEGLLPLGVTECKRIVFIGSAGSLDPGIGIGDIVIPEYSVCGDGAGRYIASDGLSRDTFGEKTYPDAHMYDKAAAEAARVCRENNVNFHIGRNFSIDSIFAQFAHIETIIGMGCNVIEMETAAAFRAAKLMNIPLAAVFSVSDNTAANKSLLSGRTAEEKERHRFTKRELIPRIITGVFS